jgi:hypothetical protein
LEEIVSGVDDLLLSLQQGWANIIDFLTMWPDVRRRVVRLLAEVDARQQGVVVRGCPTEARVRARAAF